MIIQTMNRNTNSPTVTTVVRLSDIVDGNGIAKITNFHANSWYYVEYDLNNNKIRAETSTVDFEIYGIM